MTWGIRPLAMPGEQALNELCPDGFKHYMQSLRVVDRLEKDGRGLNLTWEVRNGIVTHTKGHLGGNAGRAHRAHGGSDRLCEP